MEEFKALLSAMQQLEISIREGNMEEAEEGMCVTIYEYISRNYGYYLSDSVFAHLKNYSKLWEFYSGHPLYPIKNLREVATFPKDQFRLHQENNSLYKGAQKLLRLSLLDHWIKCVEADIKLREEDKLLGNSVDKIIVDDAED